MFARICQGQIRCVSTRAPVARLRALGEFRDRLAPVLLRSERERIVREGDDLRPLLDIIYDTRQRFKITAQGLDKFIAKGKYGAHGTDNTPDSLEELFSYLAAQPARSNATLSLIAHFLERHGVLRDGRVIEPNAYATFLRCIDRNLKCGLSHRALTTLWDAGEGGNAPAVPYPFRVALGVAGSIEAVDMRMSRWYASRKLDGIRCLLLVDGDTVTVSRTGRQLPGMQPIGASVASDMRQCPAFRRLRDTCGRVVVDGEVCVIEEHADGTFSENYSAALSAANSKSAPTGLVYFPFDLLTYDEFTDWRSATRTFAERSALLDEVVRWCTRLSRTQIRRLEQHLVTGDADIAVLKDTTVRQRWEGLILRRDAPYEGRRSSSIRKVKAWADAEYIVEHVECRRMTLMVDGQVTEQPGVSHIQIRHKGHRVSVGSGFTPAQRIHYAAHPDELIGCLVTVAYFEESTSQKGGFSLRFPRITAIFNSAVREV